MDTLQRHRLVWLDDAGWRQVLAPRDDEPPWPAASLACLHHWVSEALPLVVTRQPAASDDALMLGLSAPLRWGRERLFIRSALPCVRRIGDFPLARSLAAALPPAERGHWARLCTALDALGVAARVHGSHGWQLLTGLAHVDARSDIDLLLPCSDAAQADAAVQALQRAGIETPRLDGEVIFADGAGVAWREWAAWRAGGGQQLLVKRLRGAALEDPRAWPGAM